MAGDGKDKSSKTSKGNDSKDKNTPGQDDQDVLSNMNAPPDPGAVAVTLDEVKKLVTKELTKSLKNLKRSKLKWPSRWMNIARKVREKLIKFPRTLQN